ncbi:MAG TPA: hypothetical protein VF220_02515 [Nitrososphaeraceae archaeon]
MYNRHLAVIVIITLALFVISDLVIAHDYLYAQVNQTGQSTIFTPINNLSNGTTSNSTGIMKNTSGMLDDAFDALKDSFGSFFGK